MEVLFLLAMMAGYWRLAVDGRGVNISTAWFLPEDGFPVFYRHFHDRLTWNDARAACASHHADLLSVQTSAQADAARAYLKEMDVVDSVWIGLQRASSEEGFSWTNGEKLVGEGYWVEPAPKATERLCVAMEPAADFRWRSDYCGGPEVASFVCELGVPEWAKKEDGCLMVSLPSLTVTLLPEAGVIQLLSDCGLDGTRRTACNEKANLEEITRHLSCDVDAFASTVLTGSTTGSARRQINIDTTSSYRPLTRHRRSAPTDAPATPDTSPQNPNTPTPNKHYPHAFPHSPYLASERNAPATKPPRPATVPSTPQNTHPPPPTTPNPNAPAYQPLPVLLIASRNDSLPSAASDDPPILLMLDKTRHGPRLLPAPDDIIIDDPSLPPLQVISLRFLHTANLTANDTTTAPPSRHLRTLPQGSLEETPKLKYTRSPKSLLPPFWLDRLLG